MKCEDCPIRDECLGNLEEFVGKMLIDHAGVLTALAILGEESTFVVTVGAFLAGYIAAVKDQKSSQIDMSVWGECFDASSKT